MQFHYNEVQRGYFFITTREEVLQYGLSLSDTYQDAPFHDPNWQLVRVRKNKKAFLWSYERNGQMCINVKVDPQWRDFWRDTYESVLPGYHQNKEHWNTVILNGSIPAEEIKRMIAESYDLVVKKLIRNQSKLVQTTGQFITTYKLLYRLHQLRLVSNQFVGVIL